VDLSVSVFLALDEVVSSPGAAALDVRRDVATERVQRQATSCRLAAARRRHRRLVVASVAAVQRYHERRRRSPSISNKRRPALLVLLGCNTAAAFSKVPTPRKILGKLLILGATDTQVAMSSRGYSTTVEHCTNRPINSVQRSNRKLGNCVVVVVVIVVIR